MVKIDQKKKKYLLNHISDQMMAIIFSVEQVFFIVIFFDRLLNGAKTQPANMDFG